MPLEFAPRIETSREQVRPRHGGHCWIREKEHGDEEFFGAVQLLCAGANFAAAFDGSRHLGRMQHTKIGFRVANRIARERARNSFGRGHAEVV